MEIRLTEVEKSFDNKRVICPTTLTIHPNQRKIVGGRENFPPHCCGNCNPPINHAPPG